MTFRIFDDTARKQISQHVLGSMPVVPNRHGSNMGTDLLTQGVDTPPPYDPDPPGNYDPTPGGDYDPIGGGGSGGEGGNGRVGGIGPPSRRPGGNFLGVNLNCEVVRPLSHSGFCPLPFRKNGKTFQLAYLQFFLF